MAAFRCSFLAVALLALLASGQALLAAEQTDDGPGFNREVRPILAENCFACHGPDAGRRKAGLSLHERAGALEELEPGVRAVVPGHPEASALVERITSSEPEERMPPPESGKHLSPEQIATLVRWIRSGAPYQAHWAYVVPTPTLVPAMSGESWVRSPIDALILKGLRRQGIEPSPEADAATLVRRLGFDLVGLPPSAGMVEAFTADTRVDAYERLVDALLASPHFGERMAVWWLDLVRYADSVGYHSDNPRNVSPYRDWVINAFNADMPFDEFTREQLAGDLLPGATLQQRVASGYNRLTMTTEEGGAQAKEYECKSAADRVRNLSAVWLGSSMQCCECHDHKFDPFSQRDFYSMAAFFADIQEAAVGPREPGVPVPDAQAQRELDALDQTIAGLQQQLAAPSADLSAGLAHWEGQEAGHLPPVFGTWYHIGPFMAASAKAAFTGTFIAEPAVDLQAVRPDHLAWVLESGWLDGEIHHFVGDNSATYLYRTIDCQRPERIHLSLGSDDTITVWLNGHQVLSHEIYRGVAPDQERLEVDCNAGRNQLLIKISNGGGDYAYYFKATTTPPPAIIGILSVPVATRTTAQVAALSDYYRNIAPELAGIRSQLAEAQARREAVLAALPRCLVTTSGPARRITVKARGNWMDESGAECQPSVPHFLRQIDRAGRATRLDLAGWLTARDNPLVARVLVNRLWLLCFGTGLVKTPGDFGTQGDVPTQQELLDHLALDLIDHGWDLKRTIRLIVTSNTYRQSSQAGRLLVRDPDNRLFARQGRFRLDAEFVRDTALSLSGLLVDRQGGVSVKPYQPEGYWMHLNFPTRQWLDATGADQYRRGLYTWWQRTFLHPSLQAFDAPSREECTVERPRSDTPQQALVLLNDPTFVEAARAFAELALDQTLPGDDVRAAWVFRRALSRPPDAQEATLLLRLLAEQRALYHLEPGAAQQLAGVGQHQAPAGLDPLELASWTAVTRTVLNLQETIERN